MKRFLALILIGLTVLSVTSFAVAAYDGPNSSLWPNDWHAALNLSFNNKNASPLSPLQFKLDMTADQIDQTQGIVYRRGALELSDKATFDSKDSGLYRRASVTAAQPDTRDHKFVTTEDTVIGDTTTAAGSTIDLAVKFQSLATVDDALLKEDGTVLYSGPSYKASGLLGSYTGFALDLRSVAEYRDKNGNPKAVSGNNAATEYYLSFVNYENATLGTHQAIILVTGSASSLRNRNQSSREVYFCDLDVGSNAAYHRYTLTTDYSKCGTGEDLVTLYIDGVKATTFTAPAYSNYSATEGDHLTLGCYDTSYDANALVYDEELGEMVPAQVSTYVYLDQLSVYGCCLTPSSEVPCTFNERAPLYFEDFVAAYNEAKALTESDYSKKSWAPIAAVFAECEPFMDTLDSDHVTQSQVDDWQNRLNEAMAGLRFNTFDGTHTTTERLYIPFAYHSPDDTQGPMNSYAYAWTNSAILFNNPDYDITTYTVGIYSLLNWTSLVCEPAGNSGEFTITHFYPAGTAFTDREFNTVPEGGFILYVHTNVLDGSSSSYYASQFFGDHNAEVLAQMEEGMTVTLENTVLNPNGTPTPDTAAVLTKNGDFWRSRYDPDVLNKVIAPTSSGDLCDKILAKYPHSSPAWRDYFNGFETLSALAIQVPNTPYLDEYNEIEAKIAALKEADYTAESWANLQAVLAEYPALDLEREDLTQDMIDERADALKAAYEALVLKEDAKSDAEDDSKNSNISEDTGDHVVFIVLGVIAALAVVCAAVLVIGKKRGNF